MATKKPRLLTALGLMLALGLLSCAGFGLLVADWLKPAPADPTLTQIRHARPQGSRAMTALTTEARCALRLRVEDPEGRPIEGAEVRSRELNDPLEEEPDPPLLGETDQGGRLTVNDLDCIEQMFIVRAEDRAPARRMATPAAGGGEELLVVLPAGILIHGVVRDEGGDPLPEASVRTDGAVVQVDSRGQYELRVQGLPALLVASARGFHDSDEVIRPATADTGAANPETPDELEQDFVLQQSHQVEVFCAGMEGDDCGETLMHCTTPFTPFGDGSCSHDRNLRRTTCECPLGAAAVRGGGRAVLIEADDHEAWLDFRDASTLLGRVVLDGVPVAGCQVAALRVPVALEDLPRGVIGGRGVHCEEDGTFELQGLVAGDWELVIQGYDQQGERAEHTDTPRRILSRRTIDLGTIELRAGGAIEGTLLDGLTGAPLAYKPVIALREAAREERTTPQGETTDIDGHFTFTGLPPGSWVLTYPLSPQERTRVVVEDGLITDGVVVHTSDATALETNGFSLAEEEGELLVTEVDTEGPAALAGLEPGDRVTGVLLGGFDLSGVAQGREDQLMRAILGAWDGPGVTLVVDREGEEFEIPLEW